MSLCSRRLLPRERFSLYILLVVWDSRLGKRNDRLECSLLLHGVRYCPTSFNNAIRTWTIDVRELSFNAGTITSSCETDTNGLLS